MWTDTSHPIFSTSEVHPSDVLLLSKLRNFGSGSGADRERIGSGSGADRERIGSRSGADRERIGSGLGANQRLRIERGSAPDPLLK